LMQVADSRRQLDKTRIEIGALHAGYVMESQPVRALLQTYNSSLFDDYQSRIKSSLAQLDDLWNDISTWDAEKPHLELMALKALLHRAHTDDEQACDSASHMMAEYKMQLTKAREYAAGATR
jgi:hypothetical protein